MYNQNQADILKYAKGIMDHGFPPGVLMIDDNWQEDYGKWDFNKGRFSDPKAMISKSVSYTHLDVYKRQIMMIHLRIKQLILQVICFLRCSRLQAKQTSGKPSLLAARFIRLNNLASGTPTNLLVCRMGRTSIPV